MPNWNVEEWTKIITASVALLAVIVGPFLQWRIARRQALDNISSKRQIWIDELRKDSAEFLELLARLECLRRPNSNLSHEDQKLVFDERAAANARAYELGIRIKLRLNPNEDTHNQLVKLFAELKEICKDPVPGETNIPLQVAVQLFETQREKIITLLQSILKSEWERVKRGD